MTTSPFTTSHVRVESAKSFAEVTKDFERQLGKFDPTVLQSLRPDAEPDVATARIEAMAGPSGFMLFGTTDHGEVCRSSARGGRQFSTSLAIRSLPSR